MQDTSLQDPSSQTTGVTPFPEPVKPSGSKRQPRSRKRLTLIWGLLRNFSSILHGLPPFRLKALERLREMLGIPVKLHQTRQPFDLSKPLQARVKKLGLTDSVQQVKADGYGYIYNPATKAFNDRLKQTIIDLVGEQPGDGANMLLDKNPIFEEVVLNPKILAMTEILCGKGALLSQLRCSIINHDTPGDSLHVIQDWLPAPFPEHNQMVTFCWACDGQSSNDGAIKVVPKSHRHRRHPNKDEIVAEQGVIATECPAGSITFWDGSLWQSRWPRSSEGKQVVLHITYTRVALRPIECYDHLDQRWLAGKSFALRVLLGREDGLCTEQGALGSIDNLAKLIRMMNWSKS
ncbi:MAG: phytanoyl-CoA dioxygenase family protein [Proteobacteria bacterium]|nr:phytanoyl-CoA dioxygenase family protein [Pseudomonadota bacterium]